MEITKADLESIYVMVGQAKPAQLKSLSPTEQKAVDFMRNFFDKEAKTRIKADVIHGRDVGSKNVKIDDETFKGLEGIKAKVGHVTKKHVQFRPDHQLKEYSDQKVQDVKQSVTQFKHNLKQFCPDDTHPEYEQLIGEEFENTLSMNPTLDKDELFEKLEENMNQLHIDSSFKSAAVNACRDWVENPSVDETVVRVTRDYSESVRNGITPDDQRSQPGAIYHVIHDYKEAIAEGIINATPAALLRGIGKFINAVNARQKKDELKEEIKEHPETPASYLREDHDTRVRIYTASKSLALDKFLEYISFKDVLKDTLPPEIQKHEDIKDEIVGSFKKSIETVAELHGDAEIPDMETEVDTKLAEKLEEFRNKENKEFEKKIEKYTNLTKSIEDSLKDNPVNKITLEKKLANAKKSLADFQQQMTERLSILDYYIKYLRREI